MFIFFICDFWFPISFGYFLWFSFIFLRSLLSFVLHCVHLLLHAPSSSVQIWKGSAQRDGFATMLLKKPLVRFC